VNKSIHIILAEPSGIIQEGLRAILLKSAKKPFLSSSATLDEIIQLQMKRKADIIIINPSLIQNNVRIFNNIKNQFGDTRWIGFVYACHEKQILHLFDSIITISDPSEEILDTIGKLANNHDTNKEPRMKETLSNREIDVLKLLASGLANKEIADKLNISINTVITHRKNISQRTGIKSIPGLTIYAVLKKLIIPEPLSE
jgi:DNA-binding NarL/FixJ family response regulator